MLCVESIAIPKTVDLRRPSLLLFSLTAAERLSSFFRCYPLALIENLEDHTLLFRILGGPNYDMPHLFVEHSVPLLFERKANFEICTLLSVQFSVNYLEKASLGFLIKAFHRHSLRQDETSYQTGVLLDKIK